MAGYEHFPLLKINGLVYNGDLNWNSVMHWVCSDVLSGDLRCEGWKAFQTRILWSLSIVSMFLLFFAVTIITCKRRLRDRMETELSAQIDQSIKIYLQESGTLD